MSVRREPMLTSVQASRADGALERDLRRVEALADEAVWEWVASLAPPGRRLERLGRAPRPSAEAGRDRLGAAGWARLAGRGAAGWARPAGWARRGWPAGRAPSLPLARGSLGPVVATGARLAADPGEACPP